MAGPKRVLGLKRALAPGAVACVVLGSAACDTHSGGVPISLSEPFGPRAVAGAPGSGLGGAGAVIIPAPCVLDSIPDPVFKAQIVEPLRPAARELYSWTTDKEVAALRSDQVLFTAVEQAGLGPGYAFTYLNQLAALSPDPQQQQLANVLGGPLFNKKRYAWSEPWATRMGWPGEDYGGNLLRIVLKPEAWLVLAVNGELVVQDLENENVALSDALAHPERIGAIMFVKDAVSGGPNCNGSFGLGGNGYREFILGNLAMVEEWSLGTQQIRDRLLANIADLTRFLAQMRACPSTLNASQWNFQVVCNWQFGSSVAFDEISVYEQALAIPSENYLPQPRQVAAIIDTLQGDLFEPDPLVVKPGE